MPGTAPGSASGLFADELTTSKRCALGILGEFHKKREAQFWPPPLITRIFGYHFALSDDLRFIDMTRKRSFGNGFLFR